jgi:hypothetical protein
VPFSNILLVAVWLAFAGPVPARDGVVFGTVVNASRNKTPEAGSEVMLGIRLGNEFVPYDQTKTDAQGRFRFGRLPVGTSYSYRVGANRDGVHYPGPSLELTSQRPSASVEIAVCDAVTDPCPLVIRRQEISLRHEAGALSVTESILIENPTSTCYVGQAGEEGGEPITLRLAVPSEFTRATFDQEFYGRRFSIADGKLVTGIPWPPGKREVKFTYVLPTQSRYHRWQRPLDLPCDALRVRVEYAKIEEVACNLNRGPDEEAGKITFDSNGNTLPAGHTISVELGRLPVPFMAYARWAALAVLAIFIAGASLMLIRRRRGENASATAHPSEASAAAVAPALSTGGKRSRRKPRPSSSRRAA